MSCAPFHAALRLAVLTLVYSSVAVYADDRPAVDGYTNVTHQIEAYCQNRLNISLGYVLVCQSRRMLVAINPKVMSSSLKMLVGKLDGVQGDVLDARNLKWLHLTPQYQQYIMLNTYKRVMFVRNPYTRLYSAFFSKFRPQHSRRADGEAWLPMAKQIFAYNNVSMDDVWVGFNTTDQPTDSLWWKNVLYSVTWTHFKRAVFAGVIKDRHWDSQFNSTGVCGFDPTFVGKLENAAEDVPAMLKHIGLTEEEVEALGTLKQNVRNSSNKQLEAPPPLDFLFSEHDRHQMNRPDMYGPDFEIFGYARVPVPPEPEQY